jgi:hypothetical protein
MSKRYSVFIILFIFIGSICIVGVSSPVWAGTVGNTAILDAPKGPGLFSLRQNKKIYVKAGVDAELIFDRDLGVDAASSAEISSAEWYMGKISTVLFDRVEPYFKIGLAHMKARWKESGAEVKLESDSNLAWGVGTKVLIYEFQAPAFKILGDGYYRQADLDAETGYYDGSKVNIDSGKSRFFMREWQVALIAATEIDISEGRRGDEVLGVTSIVPYAGMSYSDVSGRLRLSWTSGSYNNPGKIDASDNLGLFAGLELLGPNSVSINLEGRFFNEAAFTGGIEVLF